ncbi:hypothetical protein IIA79_00110 [bacterium]|nr:hypothetical protein [bacterium]
MRLHWILSALILAGSCIACGNPPVVIPLPANIDLGTQGAGGLEAQASVSALPQLFMPGLDGLVEFAVPSGATHLFSLDYRGDGFTAIPYATVELQLTPSGGMTQEYHLLPFYSNQGSRYASPIALASGSYAFQVHASPPRITRTSSGLDRLAQPFMATMNATGDWAVIGSGEVPEEEPEHDDGEDDAHSVHGVLAVEKNVNGKAAAQGEKHEDDGADEHETGDGYEEEEPTDEHEDGHLEDVVGSAASERLSIVLRAGAAETLYRWSGSTYTEQAPAEGENVFFTLELEDALLGEFLPYANCHLEIESADGSTFSELDLEPILGETFFYGGNTPLDEGEYEVSVIIDPPDSLRSVDLVDAFTMPVVAQFHHHHAGDDHEEDADHEERNGDEEKDEHENENGHDDENGHAP